jgi:hypothetical protein
LESTSQELHEEVAAHEGFEATCCDELQESAGDNIEIVNFANKKDININNEHLAATILRDFSTFCRHDPNLKEP